MQEGKASCERPAAVVAAMESAETGAQEEPKKKEAKGMTIRVGRKAPKIDPVNA